MKSPILRRLSVLVVLALALFCVPAYAAGEHVSVQVIGPDASGAPAAYAPEASYELAEGEDAWTLSQRTFDDAGLTYDAENSTYGVLLNSITSPVDGTVLAYDEASGCYWQLFVDGVASEVGISGVELAEGTKIAWYYSAFGDELPTDVAALATDADATGATEAASQASFPVVPVLAVAAAAGVVAVLYLRSRKDA